MLTLEHLVPCDIGRDGWLVVIDSDKLELANCDVAPLPRCAVGLPKVEAVARMAVTLNPDAKVHPIFGTLSDRRAIEALVGSDFVFSCVDTDAARIAVAAPAARYLIPHIDFAAGGGYTKSRAVSIGGEVRLFLPGCQGCIACMGVQQDWKKAIRELNRSAEAEREQRLASNWQEERPGSYGPVLHSVIGAGMHKFWGLLTGRIRRPIWAHLDANQAIMEWHDWRRRASWQTCRVCSRLSGLGDWD